MSVEIKESTERDKRLAGNVSGLAGDLCAAQGMEPSIAYTYGVRGAQYAGEVIFIALRKIGALPEDFDEQTFTEAARDIASTSAQTR